METLYNMCIGSVTSDAHKYHVATIHFNRIEFEDDCWYAWSGNTLVSCGYKNYLKVNHKTECDGAMCIDYDYYMPISMYNCQR